MNLPELQSWVLFVLFCFLAEVAVRLRQGIDPSEVSLFPAEGTGRLRARAGVEPSFHQDS